jgi:uncharacterized protein (TIGR03437 family)
LAQDRLLGPLDFSRTVTLGQSQRRALARYDRGRVDSAFPVPYVTMLLRPSTAQQADLAQLLADQQDRSSPNYHHWLKPEQFADRFGLGNADVSILVAWLKSQGMKVQDVARGRQWITFSGAAGDIGRALRTEIHRYQIDGKDHFANATELSIPAAFQGVVAGFVGLDDFYKTARPLPAKTVTFGPDYTSPHGNHYLAPADFATIYDIGPLYGSGIDGTNQNIAVVGTSDIFLADIETFRAHFNLPLNDPQLITYGIDPGFDFNTMLEADLDLEWSGAVAPNATIIYVNAISPYLAAQYVIDTNIAPIISMSYGYCEAGLTPALEVIGQQANAQGITWLASSGDSGSAQCDSQDGYSQAGKGLAVNLPASLPEVTGVGGTQFNEGTGIYWATTNGTGMASALSYIPETAWNETSDGSPLGASGGGASIFFEKPLWQTGVGVPNDNARHVPDVALSASAAHDAYLVYFSGSLFAVGGTSAPTPAFAGMIALLTQYLTSKGLEKQPGLGNINPALYRLAETTPAAFHDITTGNNIVPCVQATPNCLTGSFGYSAGPGYDQVTGLGSVDLNTLVTHWNAGSPSSTALAASPSTIGINGGNVQLTATVTAGGIESRLGAPNSAPTGTVAFLYAENPLGSVPLVSTGATATATLAVDANQLLLGTHSLTAVYSGDSTFDGSAGSVDVTVTAPASGAAIAPAIANNPVLQGLPDANGLSWHTTLVLMEEAGVGATVTGLSVNGVSYDSHLATIFQTTTIPPHQTISGTLGFAALAAPLTQTFVFTGKDASGASWSAETSAQFLGTREVAPGIALSVTPGIIVQNPTNAFCQWQQQLIVQEQGGNYVGLTYFAMGGLDLTPSISKIFGTTQLAPFNSLQGTYCRSDAQPLETQVFEVAGVTELGEQVQASAPTTYQGPSASSPTMSVSPASITISVPASSSSGNSTLSLSFSAGTPDWAVATLPSSQTTSWLTVSPRSGSGSAQLSIHVSPGALGKGVYTAMLVIQSVNAAPQFINVPITLLVGDTSKIQIGGVGNAATNAQAFAPGMLMSVYGSQLAPAGTAQLAGTLPLPLNLVGVSATVNGLTAPLYYLSPGQLNVQVPYEASAGTAILGINNNGQVASFPFQVTAAAPGIFTDPSGSLVPNGSGKAGATLLLFITGAGDLTPSIPTGYTPAAQTPLADLPQTLLPVTVTVGGVSAKVSFAGVSYGLVGVTQINFVMPDGVPSGAQPVVVTVGGIAAPRANVTVTE